MPCPHGKPKPELCPQCMLAFKSAFSEMFSSLTSDPPPPPPTTSSAPPPPPAPPPPISTSSSSNSPLPTRSAPSFLDQISSQDTPQLRTVEQPTSRSRNPEAPKRKPTTGLCIADKKRELESALGVDLSDLDEVFKAGKLEKEVKRKAQELWEAKKNAIYEDLRAGKITEIARERSISEDEAGKLVNTAELRLLASRQTPKTSTFMDAARGQVSTSTFRGPSVTMAQYDDQGGRSTLDVMLRDILSESTLRALSTSLADKASVDKDEMRKRLIAFARSVFGLAGQNEPMLTQQGEHDDTVKELLGDQMLASLDEMSTYACLDAETFAGSVNSASGANKFILNKRLAELEGRFDEHGPAVRASNANSARDFQESDLESAEAAVTKAKSGVCTTLGMAAAFRMIAEMRKGGLEGVTSVELVSGMAADGSAHCYAVVNRDQTSNFSAPNNWLKDGCVLIDPWAGTLGCKTSFTDPRDYPAGLKKYIEQNVKSDYTHLADE